MFLPTKADNTLSMHHNDEVSDYLLNFQALPSLTLCSCSISESGRVHVAFSFAYKGGLYLIYECLEEIATQNNQDAKTQIVDDTLTLNISMGQGPCRILFGL